MTQNDNICLAGVCQVSSRATGTQGLCENGGMPSGLMQIQAVGAGTSASREHLCVERGRCAKPTQGYRAWLHKPTGPRDGFFVILLNLSHVYLDSTLTF